MLINIDSQVPNLVIYEALLHNQIKEIKDLDLLKREVTFQKSRFDLYFEKGSQKGFVEVKGVTLEKDGVAMFPDAPTERGTKHIYELIEAKKQGYNTYVCFLVQIDNILSFRPHIERDEPFAKALMDAKQAGVQIIGYNSIITPESIEINEPVKISLGG
jgi:sugar fermentation stimulation protein A